LLLLSVFLLLLSLLLRLLLEVNLFFTSAFRFQISFAFPPAALNILRNPSYPTDRIAVSS
jgi:hypothetical protein